MRSIHQRAGSRRAKICPIHPNSGSAHSRLIGVLMSRSVHSLVNLYDPTDSLDRAWTIPSPWYFDPAFFEAERSAVFGNSWQAVGRTEQVREPGQFFTADVA